MKERDNPQGPEREGAAKRDRATTPSPTGWPCTREEVIRSRRRQERMGRRRLVARDATAMVERDSRFGGGDRWCARKRAGEGNVTPPGRGAFDLGDDRRTMGKSVVCDRIDPRAHLSRRGQTQTGLEIDRHLSRRRVPLVRIPLEPAHDDSVDPRRQVGRMRRRRRDLRRQDLAQDLLRGVALEQTLACKHFPERHRGCK